MDAILTFLARPEIRFVLTLVGSFLLKRWGAFFNKAIPLAGAVLNGLLLTLNTMFGVQPAHAGTAVHDVLFSPIVDALWPWLSAIGLHSAIKNGVLEWARAGYKLFVK